MVEFAEYIPFIGFGIAILVPVILKKVDFGKASRNKQEQDMEKLEERLRLAELKLVRLERNNNHK